MSLDYIAGFFDGEGHARIDQHGRSALVFTNTNRETLETIRAFLRYGTIHEKHPSRTGLGKKMCYVLHVSERPRVLELAKALKSRCIIKKDALGKLIEFTGPLVVACEQRQEALRCRVESELRLYESGLSIAEIARRTGTPYARLCHHLQRAPRYLARPRTEVMRLAWLRRHSVRNSSPCLKAGVSLR